MDIIDSIIKKLNAEHEKKLQGLEAMRLLPKEILLEALNGLTQSTTLDIKEKWVPMNRNTPAVIEGGSVFISSTKSDVENVLSAITDGGKTLTVLNIVKAHPEGIRKEEIRPLYAKARGLEDEDRIEREVTNSLSTLRKTNKIEMGRTKGIKGGTWAVKG